MPRLIKDSQIVEDDWVMVGSSSEAVDLAESGQRVFMPLELLQAVIADIPVDATIGVLLEPGQEPSQVCDYIDRLQLVAVNFPVFTDGRGFSYARELRQTHEFAGELRATGDIMRDQFHYLKRSGFNAFQPDDDSSLESDLQSLDDFSDAYQASIDRPEPLFRRR